MSLSAHLLETQDRKPFATHPPPATPFNPDTSWMSSHGYPSGPSHLPPKLTPWSEEKVAHLQNRLARKLGPEYVSQRQGPGGGPKLSYIEGWKVINLANEVFGFNGWSSSIVSLTTDFCDVNEQGRVSCMITAIVRITLADGCFREDVGGGQAENIKGKGSALDKAKKEAVTDAIKRALRNFGNVLGMCLYDREYTKEVAKMKVPPAKFTPVDLERRPEFTDAPQAGPSRPSMSVTPSTASAVPQHMSNANKAPAPFLNGTIAPGTPLRSIMEVETGTYGGEDSFDMEFVDPEFLEGVEESMMEGLVEGGGKEAKQAPSRVDPPRPEAPKYQHRHRPDPGPQQPIPNRFVHASRQSSCTIKQGEGSSSSSGNRPSSGERAWGSETMQENIKKSSAGFPNQSTSAGNSGSSARRLAISSAMAQTPQSRAIPPPPVRAESPKIPTGGIDQVAAKAITVLRQSGEALNFDQNTLVEKDYLGSAAVATPEQMGEVKFGGFSSARGMKREISGDRLSISPTKQQQGQKTGPRMALGELSIPPESGDWKRQRAM